MEFLLNRWLPKCLLPTIVSYLDFHGVCVREIESDVAIDKLIPFSNGDLLRYCRNRKLSLWDQNKWIELCNVPPSTSFQIQNDKVWFISERSVKRYNPYTLEEDKRIYTERIRDAIVLDDTRLMLTQYKQFTLIDGTNVNVVNTEMPSYGQYLLLNDCLLAHISRRDSIIGIWNYKTGVLVRNVQDHDTNVDSIDLLSPDEMISQGGKMVKIWNLKTWQCTKSIPMQDVARPLLAVSHHQFLVRYTNKMRLWDTNTSTSRLLMDGKFFFIQKQNGVVTYAGQTIHIWK